MLSFMFNQHLAHLSRQKSSGTLENTKQNIKYKHVSKKMTIDQCTHSNVNVSPLGVAICFIFRLKSFSSV